MDDILQKKTNLLIALQKELIEGQRVYQEQVKNFLESPSEEAAKKIMMERNLNQSSYDRYVQDREALATFLKHYPWSRIELERTIAKLRNEIAQIENERAL